MFRSIPFRFVKHNVSYAIFPKSQFFRCVCFFFISPSQFFFFYFWFCLVRFYYLLLGVYAEVLLLFFLCCFVVVILSFWLGCSMFCSCGKINYRKNSFTYVFWRCQFLLNRKVFQALQYGKTWYIEYTTKQKQQQQQHDENIFRYSSCWQPAKMHMEQSAKEYSLSICMSVSFSLLWMKLCTTYRMLNVKIMSRKRKEPKEVRKSVSIPSSNWNVRPPAFVRLFVVEQYKVNRMNLNKLKSFVLLTRWK